MGRNYVMSDIHGMYEHFLEMLKKISFSKSDKLYILGDVLDRGNHPFDTLFYIMKNPNIEMELGNHEEMLLYYLALKKRGGVDFELNRTLHMQKMEGKLQFFNLKP